MIDLRGTEVIPKIKKAYKEGYPVDYITEELFKKQSGEDKYTKRECGRVVWSVILEMWHDEFMGEDII